MSKLERDVVRILGLHAGPWEPPLPLLCDLKALRVAATEDAARGELSAAHGDIAELKADLKAKRERIEQYLTTAPEPAVDVVMDTMAACMTPTQKEIVHLRATGLSYPEIAKELGLKIKRVARAEITTLCLANRAIDAS